MNNNRKRVFRIRQNKGGFRRRGGGQNSNLQINSFNNRGFNKNGSMSNPANVEKAIQKYNQLAKDAQSSGDLILVQNYLQHADHFSRILSRLNSEENKLQSNSQEKSDQTEEKIK